MRLPRLPRTTPTSARETIFSFACRLGKLNHIAAAELSEIIVGTRLRDRLRPATFAVSAAARERLGELAGLSDAARDRAFPATGDPTPPQAINRRSPVAACRRCTARAQGGTVWQWAPAAQRVCRRHHRWIGPSVPGKDAGQLDVAAVPEVVAAHRHYQRLVARYGYRDAVAAMITAEAIMLAMLKDTDLLDGTVKPRMERLLQGTGAHRYFAFDEDVVAASVFPSAVDFASVTLSPTWLARLEPGSGFPDSRRAFIAEINRRVGITYSADFRYRRDPLCDWLDAHNDPETCRWLAALDDLREAFPRPYPESIVPQCWR
jgi:hypothetical protein